MPEVLAGPAEVLNLHSLRSLLAVESQWEELVGIDFRATPFQSPFWLIPWWERFGRTKLNALAVYREGRLEGLAPLCCEMNSPTGAHFALIGAGVSDYLDIIFAPGAEEFVIATLLDSAVGTPRRGVRSDSDRSASGSFPPPAFDFLDVPAQSALLRATLPGSWKREVLEQNVCAYVDLSEADPRTESMLKRASREFHRLAQAGDARVTLTASEDLDPNFRMFVDLHAASWESRGGAGVLASPEIQSFHLAVARKFVKRGNLRLYMLWSGLRAIGALYGFYMHGRFFYYLGGFDPAYRQYSPGTILIGHALREAIGAGAKEFDFLRGVEPYKYRWGAKNRSTYRVRLTRA